MPSQKRVVLSHFHRNQIGKAQRYIRTHFTQDLSLTQISREAGSSSFHFGRMFLAYTGETTFSYLRRLRLGMALKMLQEDEDCPVTEIALSVGYDTPAAFNKVFKKVLNLNPGEFRNLSKDNQDRLISKLNKSSLANDTNLI